MLYDRKGQAIVEMAIFGSIILLLFSVLLSYVQRLNDQQYVQMESFRRVLEKAHKFPEGTPYQYEGAGCAAQLSLLQNRHHSDILAGFRKGSTQMLSGSSSVYWAVPSVDGTKSYSVIAYRVNEDEREITLLYDYGDKEEKGDEKIKIYVGDEQYEFAYDPDDEDFDLNEQIFRMEDMSFGSETEFSETIEKKEGPDAITNTRRSALQDKVTAYIPYSIGPEPEEGVPIEDWKTFWDARQGLYRDVDGQYKYNESTARERVKDQEAVERERTWRTPF